jgi:hypothetical protein
MKGPCENGLPNRLGRRTGDAHDARFLDSAGAIVGLKAKGSAKSDLSGFVIRHPQPLPKNIGHLALAA